MKKKPTSGSKKKDTKIFIKRVRLNQKEMDLLKPILKTFKNNFSKFVLFNIRNPKNFKEDKNAENTIILSKILKEIHAIGVNLNQTQHFLNTKKDQLHQISIKKLQGKIDSIHIELESIKKKITHDH
jgi:hypothetical protein